MNLYEAFNKTATTANGAVAHHSSLSACLDFFYVAGASRGKNITSDFVASLAENEDVTLRTLLWMRDAREGAGERQQFKDLVKVLVELDKPIDKLISKVPELGRWDDLLIFEGTKYQDQAFDLIFGAIKEGNSLCAKWMPRQGKIANALRKHFGIKTPKEYRKLLVSLSDVVETKMCAKQWNDINFESVPSVAAARYQKAFARNAQASYTEYKDKLSKGEAKVNASVVYPYDVVKACINGDAAVADAQWKALPNYLDGVDERILPIVDVSGSMSCKVGGYQSKSETSCMDVAVSLGLYLSERNEGVLKNVFMTFSESPQLLKLEGGTLKERVLAMKRSKWGMSTNIQLVFETLLSAAVSNNVPENQMPTKLLIVSDMQFNQCMDRGNDVSAYDLAKSMYEQHGYKLPQIVFWNVNCQSGTVPVTKGTAGTALVSGFSPSIMKSLLKGAMTPEKVMLDTVMIDRYSLEDWK